MKPGKYAVNSASQTAIEPDAVAGVAFSPDGKHLATASDDETAKLWDVEPDTVYAPPSAAAETATLHEPPTLSEAQIDQLFPTSKDLSSLAEPFRSNVGRFVVALESAGAKVDISKTLESPEKAYLMHYAFLISKDNMNPRMVPQMEHFHFDWVRRNSDGSYSEEKSRKFAESIVKSCGLVFAPNLVTNHIKGQAIDMEITWSGTLNVKRADGSVEAISTIPKSGSNSELVGVAKTYKVYKLASDPPHWSADGH